MVLLLRQNAGVDISFRHIGDLHVTFIYIRKGTAVPFLIWMELIFPKWFFRIDPAIGNSNRHVLYHFGKTRASLKYRKSSVFYFRPQQFSMFQTFDVQKCKGYTRHPCQQMDRLSEAPLVALPCGVCWLASWNSGSSRQVAAESGRYECNSLM